MDIVERFRAWIAAFDKAVETGDWAPLRPWVTQDVRYVVSGSPFATSLSGREAVLNGLERSIRNFDKKFDRRFWIPVATRVRAPHTIEVNLQSRYEKAGLPPLVFPAFCSFTFRGDQIDLMQDLYDDTLVETQEAYAWLAAHPGGYDPSYA